MSDKIVAQLRQANEKLRAELKAEKLRAKDLRAELDKRVVPVEEKAGQLKARDKNQRAEIKALRAELADAQKQIKALEKERKEMAVSK